MSTFSKKKKRGKHLAISLALLLLLAKPFTSNFYNYFEMVASLSSVTTCFFPLSRRGAASNRVHTTTTAMESAVELGYPGYPSSYTGREK
jgi:Na+/H+ antiporter NhaB